MARYLAVRTGAPSAHSTLFYVVDADSGLAVTTHGSWSDALATARMGNEDPTDHREAYCRQCETTLSVDALTAECGVCGSRYIGTMGGAQ